MPVMSLDANPVIFISYRRADANDVVDRLDEDLTEVFSREAIFRDKSLLKGGQEWTSEIERKASGCRVMLVVIGTRWVSERFKEGQFAGFPRLFDPEDWVRKEITIALQQEKIVIPVMVNDAQMPDATWLKNFGLEELANKQGVRFRTDEYSGDKADLIELLRGYLPSLQHRDSEPERSDGRAISEWRPTPEWQLRHLERLTYEIGVLRPAIPPREGRQQWPLSEVFVSLELHARRGAPQGGHIEWGRLIDSDRIALIGAPGSGKSTLLRHLVLVASEHRSTRLKGDIAPSPPDEGPTDRLARIPVWIDVPTAARELRAIKEAERRKGVAPAYMSEFEPGESLPLRDLVADDWLDVVATATNLYDREKARGLLDTGEVLLVFDGLDEVADPRERIELTDSLAKLPTAYGGIGMKNPVVIGCRDKAWQRGKAFAPFDEILAQPMDRPKREEYLKRWCQAVWEDQAAAVLNNLNRSLRSERAVQELASNPQTATMLAILAQLGPLPRHRVLLYDAFVRSALNSERMHQHGGLLAVRKHLIALALAIQNARTPTGEQIEGLSENDARLILGRRLLPQNAQEPSRAEIRELGRALLDGLELHTGLISTDRSEGARASRTMVRFNHRTIQEFLVASHYVDDPKAILDQVTNPAWLVSIALTAGLIAQEEDDNVLKHFLDCLVRTPDLDSGPSDDELVEWGKRVAVLSACLEKLSNWDLPEETLAPAIKAHEMSAPLLTKFDLSLRVSIAEGMGILRDPRLVPASASRWVQIGAGRLLLGSDSVESWVQEQPVREVCLSEYWIQRWPVTNREYARFVEDADGYRDDTWWDKPGLQWRNENAIEAPEGWELSNVYGNRPVTGISWWEARAYARWLTNIEDLPKGWMVSLPTEAQWERAARGPFESPSHRTCRFPWGDNWDWKLEHANCNPVLLKPCPVGLFPAGNSAEGIWDLSGNVSEMCLDGFGPPRPAADEPDPCCLDYKFGHAMRGGDYASPALNARVSARFPKG
jgi:formylglycine-generating enzyme required for sulfatase activity/energy-coupling factor transporter ATP-binding protein EcfA2